MPESANSIQVRRFTFLNSSRFRIQAAGIRSKETIVNLQAAIASEGASIWAYRINMDEVDTHKMAKTNPMAGERLGLLESFTDHPLRA